MSENSGQLVQDLSSDGTYAQDIALRVIVNAAAEGYINGKSNRKALFSSGGRSHWKSQLVQCGVIPALSRLIDRNYSDVQQMLACWALSNLCYQNEDVQNAMCKDNMALKVMKRLLDETANEDVIEKVLWALQNTAKTTENRKAIAESGIISSLAKLFELRVSTSSYDSSFREVDTCNLRFSPRIVTQAASALANILREGSVAEAFCEADSVLKNLMSLLECDNDKIKRSVGNILLVMTARSGKILRKVSGSDFIKRLHKTLHSSQTQQTQRTIIQLLCNLTLDDSCFPLLLNERIVVSLVDLLFDYEEQSMHSELVACLLNVSLSEDLRTEIRRSGGIARLLALVREASFPPLTQRDQAFLHDLFSLLVNLSVDAKSRSVLNSHGAPSLFESIAKQIEERELYKDLHNSAQKLLHNLELPDDTSEIWTHLTNSQERSKLQQQQQQIQSQQTSNNYSNIDSIIVQQLQVTNNNSNNSGSRERSNTPYSEAIIAAVKQEAEEDRMFVRRQQVVHEILYSEKEYVRNLKVIIDLYLDVLESQHEGGEEMLITPKQVKQIFSCVRIIYQLNEKFYNDLKKEVEGGNARDSLGQLFIELASYLKMYSTYVNNYDEAIRILMELRMNNPEWKNFTAKQRALPESRNLSLEDYLIQPVQRVPRYRLLLQEVVKHSPQHGKDYENLCKALEEMEKLANFLNEAKHSAENLAQMFTLQAVIQNYPRAHTLVQPGRKLLKQGIILVLQENKKRSVYRYLFLFTDFLMITKQQKDTYNFKEEFLFSHTHLVHLPDTLDYDNEKKQCTFYASSEDSKRKWMTAVDSCIKTESQRVALSDHGSSGKFKLTAGTIILQATLGPGKLEDLAKESNLLLPSPCSSPEVSTSRQHKSRSSLFNSLLGSNSKLPPVTLAEEEQQPNSNDKSNKHKRNNSNNTDNNNNINDSSNHSNSNRRAVELLVDHSHIEETNTPKRLRRLTGKTTLQPITSGTRISRKVKSSDRSIPQSVSDIVRPLDHDSPSLSSSSSDSSLSGSSAISSIAPDLSVTSSGPAYTFLSGSAGASVAPAPSSASSSSLSSSSSSSSSSLASSTKAKSKRKVSSRSHIVRPQVHNNNLRSSSSPSSSSSSSSASSLSFAPTHTKPAASIAKPTRKHSSHSSSSSTSSTGSLSVTKSTHKTSKSSSSKSFVSASSSSSSLTPSSPSSPSSSEKRKHRSSKSHIHRERSASTDCTLSSSSSSKKKQESNHSKSSPLRATSSKQKQMH
ncbi:Dbly domain-containing protein [Balamuthia mandrillaris]